MELFFLHYQGYSKTKKFETNNKYVNGKERILRKDIYTMSDSPENSHMKRISYVNPTQSHRKGFLFFPKNS